MSSHPLNADQEAAARALDGLVLIAAGAGSGKTRTLAERFARAASDEYGAKGEIPADRILTITYTEKAAGELAERVRATLHGLSRQDQVIRTQYSWISTIHGFCVRVLRRFALEAGVDPLFQVADPVEAGKLSEHAFAEACEAALATEEGRMLLGDFEYEAVFGAITRLARELSSRGLGASALRAPGTRPAHEIIDDAISLFEGGRSEIAACGGSAPSGARLQNRCSETSEALTALRAVDLPAEELSYECWKVLVSWKAGHSNKAIAEVRETLMTQHAVLRGQAAAAASSHYAAAMIGMTERYMAAYTQLKAERALMDFDDLQIRVRELLESSPAVEAACSSMFDLIMVDEFQDTDALQAEIVTRIAGDRLCTVGDECQSIYGFRGADVDVYRAHNASMASHGARSFSLRYNYRSHPDIIRFVNGLFSDETLLGSALIPLEHGREEPSEPLLTEGEPRVEIVMVDGKDLDAGTARRAEAGAVAERLASLRDTHGIRGGDIAVLLRSYAHADTYADALRACGFEASVVGGSRFFALPEVQALRCLASVLANVRDEKALVALLAGDMGRISDDGLWFLCRCARAGERELWDTLTEPPSELSCDDKRRSLRIASVLAEARASVGHMPLSEILLNVVGQSGWGTMLLAGGERDAHRYANVAKFARMASAFEAAGGTGPASFVSYLDARERFKEHTPPASVPDERTGTIRIMSVHAAKGLEFPVVVAADLGSPGRASSDIMRSAPEPDGGMLVTARVADSCKEGANRPPEFARLDSEAKDRDRAEAKRVFYVAATRAREVLILSGVAQLSKDSESAPEVPLTWLRRAAPLIDRAIGHDRSIEIQGVPVGLTVAEPVDVAGEYQRADENADQYEPDAPAVAAPPRVFAQDVMTPPRTLSYSDMAMYGRCPKRFWAERVMRIGSIRSPADESALTFGTAVHAALEASVDGITLDSSRLDAIRRYHGVTEQAAAEFDSAVKACLGSNTLTRLNSMPVVRREWGFGVRISTEPLLDLVGTLDAYGREGSAALVVDYKTGVSGEESELRPRYELQARCYAVAAFADGAREVTVEFLRPQCLNDHGQPHTTTFTFATPDVAAIQAQIQAAHQRMAAGEYDALAARDREVCRGCAIAENLCRAPEPL